jgi:hypothetical protein
MIVLNIGVGGRGLAKLTPLLDRPPPKNSPGGTKSEMLLTGTRGKVSE